MTVSSTNNKIAYIGNGVAKEFPIPFRFFDPSHLKVFQLYQNIQTQRTDWHIEKGDLFFDTAPVSGARILIIRELPYTQETDYQENALLSAKTLERNFDTLVMQIQQLKERTDRAITVDLFDKTKASDLLPSVRQAVSDSATYAQTATEQAQTATEQAQTATQQATLATAKAQEAVDTLANKANIALDNIVPCQEARQKFATYDMPDYSAGVEIPATLTDQIMPFDGWLVDRQTYTNGGERLIINDTPFITGCPPATCNWIYTYAFKVAKNDRVRVTIESRHVITLYPFRGV